MIYYLCLKGRVCPTVGLAVKSDRPKAPTGMKTRMFVFVLLGCLSSFGKFTILVTKLRI